MSGPRPVRRLGPDPSSGGLTVHEGTRLELEPPAAISRATARARLVARGEVPTSAALAEAEREVLEELAELLGGEVRWPA